LPARVAPAARAPVAREKESRPERTVSRRFSSSVARVSNNCALVAREAVTLGSGTVRSDGPRALGRRPTNGAVHRSRCRRRRSKRSSAPTGSNRAIGDAPKRLPHVVEDRLEVRPARSIFVHEDDARHAVGSGLMPNDLGLRLHASPSVKTTTAAVQDPQAPRSTSAPWKSTCPGVSMMLIWWPRHWQVSRGAGDRDPPLPS